MDHYTNIFQRGKYILSRGVDDHGNRFQRREEFNPTMFVPSQEKTEYRNIQMVKKKSKNLNDGPPFYVNLEKTLSLFESNFNFIKIDDNPKSIKPRKGFEALAIMEKK